MKNKLDEIKVERLSPKDAKEIESLFKEVWPTAVEYPKGWRKKRMLNRKEIIEEMEEGYYYFGMRKDGRIVGVYKASINGGTVLGEHQSVHPDYTGQGLATAMYEQIVNFARGKGCKRIHVNVLVNQAASRKCAEKLNFHKKGDPYEQYKGMVVQLYERKV